MMFNTFLPHVEVIVKVLIDAIKKCKDRKWTCDKRRTSQLTQQEYEDMNMGPEFPVEDRYSQVLALIWITFMFSAGLPLLYPIAMVTLFIMYWVDKVLCKQPPNS